MRRVEGICPEFSLPAPATGRGFPWRTELRSVQQKATASGVLPDWDASQARMELTATNLPFAKEIRDPLPERQRELWDKFRPEGSVTVTGEAAMNGDHPRFVGQVALHDNAFSYEKFPLQISGAQGSVDFQPDGRIEVNVVAPVGGGVTETLWNDRGLLADCGNGSDDHRRGSAH